MTTAQQVYERVTEADALASLVREIGETMGDTIERSGTDVLHSRLVKAANEVEQFADRLFATFAVVLGETDVAELRVLDGEELAA